MSLTDTTITVQLVIRWRPTSFTPADQVQPPTDPNDGASHGGPQPSNALVYGDGAGRVIDGLVIGGRHISLQQAFVDSGDERMLRAFLAAALEGELGARWGG